MRILVCLLFICLYALPVSAELVRLENGKEFKGVIVEKTEEYVRIKTSAGLVKVPFKMMDQATRDVMARFQIPSSAGKSGLDENSDVVTSIPAPQLSPVSAELSDQGAGQERRTEPVGESGVLSAKEVFNQGKQAVVFIANRTRSGAGVIGSGFVIDPDGIVITNYHVVREGKDIRVSFIDGSEYPVESIINYDAGQDVCILRIKAKNLEVLKLGDSAALTTGDIVYTIGNPLGLDYSMSNGIISGRRVDQNRRWLQFTAPISPGNSGGPLLNAQGEAVGLITFLMQEGQNLNFALESNDFRVLLGKDMNLPFQQFVATVSRSEELMQEAVNYEGQGNFAKAIDSINQAININPQNAQYYKELALNYYQGGLSGEYLEALKKAFELAPSDFEVLEALGGAYLLNYLNGSNKDALYKSQEAARKLLELADSQELKLLAMTLLCRVFSFGDQDNLALAQEYCEQVLDVRPKDPQAFLNLARIYSLGGQKLKYREYLEKAFDADPNDVSILLRLAISLFESGESRKALGLFLRSIELNPMVSEAYYYIAKIYFQNKDMVGASRYLNQCNIIRSELYRRAAASILPVEKNIERVAELQNTVAYDSFSSEQFEDIDRMNRTLSIIYVVIGVIVGGVVIGFLFWLVFWMTKRQQKSSKTL